MNFKSICALAFSAVAVASFAEYPVEFRDCNQWDPWPGDCDTPEKQQPYKDNPTWNGGGHFWYDVVPGTRSGIDTSDPLNDGKPGWNYGTPVLDAEGFVNMVSNGMGDGQYFRTKKMKADDADVPEDHTILAFDYKSDRTIGGWWVNPIPDWNGDGRTAASVINYNAVVATTETRTAFLPFARGAYGTGDAKSMSYFWVGVNDPNGKEAGWHFDLKNIRLLSVAEAEALCAAATGDVVDNFTMANTSFLVDVDEDMDGENMYVMNPDGDKNPVMRTNDIVCPLPAEDTDFVFEYKMVGDNYKMNFHLLQGNVPTKSISEAFELVGEDADGIYESEWKVARIHLADAIEEVQFGKKFAANDYAWLQFKDFPEGNILYIRNPKWTTFKEDKPEVAINDVDADLNETAVYYNLQGVRVENPANGLFIKVVGNKAAKVAVK